MRKLFLALLTVALLTSFVTACAVSGKTAPIVYDTKVAVMTETWNSVSPADQSGEKASQGEFPYSVNSVGVYYSDVSGLGIKANFGTGNALAALLPAGATDIRIGTVAVPAENVTGDFKTELISGKSFASGNTVYEVFSETVFADASEISKIGNVELTTAVGMQSRNYDTDIAVRGIVAYTLNGEEQYLYGDSFGTVNLFDEASKLVSPARSGEDTFAESVVNTVLARRALGEAIRGDYAVSASLKDYLNGAYTAVEAEGKVYDMTDEIASVISLGNESVDTAVADVISAVLDPSGWSGRVEYAAESFFVRTYANGALVDSAVGASVADLVASLNEQIVTYKNNTAKVVLSVPTYEDFFTFTVTAEDYVDVAVVNEFTFEENVVRGVEDVVSGNATFGMSSDTEIKNAGTYNVTITSDKKILSKISTEELVTTVTVGKADYKKHSSYIDGVNSDPAQGAIYADYGNKVKTISSSALNSGWSWEDNETVLNSLGLNIVAVKFDTGDENYTVGMGEVEVIAYGYITATPVNKEIDAGKPVSVEFESVTTVNETPYNTYFSYDEITKEKFESVEKCTQFIFNTQGVHKAYYYITAENHHALSGYAEFTIILLDPELSVSVANKTYNGAAPEVTVSNKGTSTPVYTWYSVAEDGTETELTAAPVNVGKYKVKVNIEANTVYFADEAISQVFEITPADLTVTIPNNPSFFYNAQPHSVSIASVKGNNNVITVYTVEYSTDGGASWAAEAPSFINAGEYKVDYRVTVPNYNIYNSAETDESDSITVTIQKIYSSSYKKTYDGNVLDGNSKTQTYDGNVHAFAISEVVGLNSIKLTQDTDYTVSYTITCGEETVSEIKNVGTYKVSYTVKLNNYNDITDSVTVTINPATITDKTVKSVDGVYNAQPYTAIATGTTVDGSDVTVRYVDENGNYTVEEAPSFTEVGTYTVYYKITAANHSECPDSITVTITKKDITYTAPTAIDRDYNGTDSKVEVTDVSTGIDGQTATVEYSTDDGASWSTTVPVFNNVCDTTVKYRVYAGDNYETYNGSVTVEIKAVKLSATFNYDGEAVNNNAVTKEYDGEAHSVTVGSVTGINNSAIEYTASYAITFNGAETTEIKAAGSYKVTYTIQADNYITESFEIAVSITSAQSLNVTATGDISRDYDGTEYTVKVLSVSGIGGNITDYTVEYSTNGTAWRSQPYTFKDVTNGTVTVKYRVSVTNYNTATGQVTVNITCKKLKADKVPATTATKEYNGQPYVVETIEGVTDVTGETATVTTVITKNSTTVDQIIDAGIYTVTYTVSAGNNYENEVYTTVVTVTAASLSVTVPEAINKVFDGKESTFKVTATGVNGYTAKVEYKVGDGTWKEETPTFYDVVTTTVEYRITASDNYKPRDNGTINVRITNADMTVTATDETATYDGETHTASISVATKAGDYTIMYRETASGEYNLGAMPTYTDAGTYTIYYQVTANNHNPKDGSVKVEIAKANIVLASEPANKAWTYDGSTRDVDSITASLVEGNTQIVTYTVNGVSQPTLPSFKNVGEYTVVYNISAGDNYNADTRTVTVKVTAKDINVAIVNGSKEWTYNGESYTVEVKAETGVTGETATVEYKVNNTIKTPTFVNAGTYNVTFSVSASGNYNIIYPENREIVVKVKEATIEAIATGVTTDYDATAHSAIVTNITTVNKTAYAIVYGNTNGGSEYGSAMPSFTNAGTYTVYYKITADNHEALTGSVTVVINKVALTITAESKSVTYGEGVELTYTTSGLKGNDKVTSVEYTCTYTVGSDVVEGGYKIEVSNAQSAALANYNVTYVYGTLTVIMREVSVEWVEADGYTYTGSKIAPKAYITLYNGADREISVTINGEGIAVGNYIATASLDTELDKNYKITSNETKTYTITQAAGVVTLPDLSHLADESTNTATVEFNAADFVATGDGVVTNVEFTGNPTVTKNGTNYTVILGLGNYTITVTVVGTNYSYANSYTKDFVIYDANTVKFVGGNLEEDANGNFTATIKNGVEYTLTVTNATVTGWTVNGIEQADKTKLTFTAVGTYAVNATVEFIGTGEIRYLESTVTISSREYSVYKSELNITEPASKSVVYRKDLKLSDSDVVVLPTSEYGTWSWKEGTVLELNAIGTYTFTAVFTPNSAYAGYLNGEVTVTVNVTPATLTVSKTDKTDAIYNGGEYSASVTATTVDGTTPTILYGTVEGQYTLDVMPKFVNAGTYTIYYQVTANNHNTEYGSVKVVIGKADNNVDLTITVNDTANTNQNVTATYGDVIEYSAVATYAENGYTWSFGDTAPTGKGTYEITVSVSGGNNYKDASATYTLTINQATTTISVKFNGDEVVFDETGKAEKAVNYKEAYAIAAESNFGMVNITYDGEATAPTNADSYNVVIKVEGNANYTSKEYIIDLTINKLDNSIKDFVVTRPNGSSDESIANGDEIFYNGEAVTYVADANVKEGGATVTYNVYKKNGEAFEAFTGAIVGVGTYKIEAIIAETTNYNSASASIEFIIKQADNTVAFVEPDNASASYTGNAITVNVETTATFGTAEVKYYYNGSEVQSTEIVNAGEYTIVATVAGTADYKEATVTKTFTVNKATTNEINFTTDFNAKFDNDTNNGWKYTYNGNPIAEITATADFGTVKVTYDGSEVVPTDAGTYEVKAEVEGNDNYVSGSETATLVIEKRDNNIDSFTVKVKDTVVDSDNDIEITYSDGVSVSAQSSYLNDTLVYQYKQGKQDDTEWSTWNGGKDAAGNWLSVGTYTVRAYVAGDNNNNAVYKTATIIITPATGSITLSSTEWTYYYGDNIEISARASISDIGTPIIEYSADNGTTWTTWENGAKLDVGNYTVKATLYADNNYAIDPAEQTLTINQATTTISVKFNDAEVEFDETGKAEKAVNYKEAYAITAESNFGMVNITYDGEATAPTNAGSYKVVIKVEGNANYTSKEYTIDLTINKLDNAIKDFVVTRLNDSSVEESIANGDEIFYNGKTVTCKADANVNEGGATVTYNVYKKNGEAFDAFIGAIVGVGTYKIEAIIAETTNYNSASASIEFTIKQADNTVAFVEPDNASASYTGNAITVNVETTAAFGTAEVKYYYNAKEVQSTDIVNAGKYTIKATVAGTENYAEATAEKTFTVDKATENNIYFNTKFNNDNKDGWKYTYNGNPIVEITATAVFGTVNVTYYDDENNIVVVPTNAGTYTVVATVAETDNYVSGSKTATLVINKIQVSLVYDTSDLIYNEEPQAPVIKEVSIKDASCDLSYVEATKEYSIDVLLPTSTTATTMVSDTLTLKFKEDTLGTDVGDYKATVVLEGECADNYEISTVISYNIVAADNVVNLTITVTKANGDVEKYSYTNETVTVTKANGDVETHTYTNGTVTVTVTATYGDTITYSPAATYVEDEYTWSSNPITRDGKPTTPGTYDITVTAAGGRNYKTGNRTIKLTINKADIKDVSVYVPDNYSYGQSVELRYEGAIPTGLTITYQYRKKDATDWTTVNNDATITGLDIGTYEARLIIAESTNYNSYTSQAKSFVVDPATGSITLSSTKWTYSYGDSIVISASVNISGIGTPTIQYSADNGETWTPWENGTNLNVGSYKVKATLDAGNNYAIKLAEETLTINQATNRIFINGVETDSISLPYNPDGYADLIVAKDLNNKVQSIDVFYYFDAEENPVEIAATELVVDYTYTYIAIITFTAQDTDNYASRTVYVEVEIVRAGVELTWSGYTNLTYTGDEQIPTATFTVNGATVDAIISVTKDGVATDAINAGEYVATATLPDSYQTNYTITGYANCEYTIAKRKVMVWQTAVPTNASDKVANATAEWDYVNGGKTVSAMLENMVVVWADNTSIALVTTEYNIDETTNGYEGVSYATTATITEGNTYKTTYTLVDDDNYEWNNSSAQYAYIKYKTAKVGGILYTIEDAIAQNADITLVGDGTLNAGDKGVVTAFTGVVECYNNVKTYNLTKKLLMPYNQDGKLTTSGSAQLSNGIYTVLYIPSGFTLNIKPTGQLLIGGAIQGDGKVHGRSVAVNAGTINVEKNGQVTAYGYLRGSGVVNLYGTLIDVLRVYDYLGGRNTYGIIGEDIFPFEAFNVHNNACYTKIYPEASYQATYAFDAIMWVQGTVNVLGSSAMFNVTNGCIEKYVVNPQGERLFASDDYKNISDLQYGKGTQLEKIIMAGNCSDGSITINVAGVSDVTTGPNIPLNIGYMDIVVASGATLNISAVSYKFLPGSSITVEDGATINISTTVYLATIKKSYTHSNFTATSEGNYQANGWDGPFISETENLYAARRENAKLIIGGTVNVSAGGCLAGYVVANEGGILAIGSTDTPSIKYVSNLAYSSWSLGSSVTPAEEGDMTLYGLLANSTAAGTPSDFIWGYTANAPIASVMSGKAYVAKWNSELNAYCWMPGYVVELYDTTNGFIYGYTAAIIGADSMARLESYTIDDPLYDSTIYYDEQCTTPVSDAITFDSNGSRCYIKFKAETIVYTIGLKSNGADVGTSVTRGAGQTISIEEIYTPAEREGYAFRGWSPNESAEAGALTYVVNADDATEENGTNIILYAIWEDLAELTLDANGGSVDGSNATISSYISMETTIDLFALGYEPVRVGYIFLGWATTKDATTAEFTSDGTTTLTIDDAQIVLYAVWKSVPKITLNSNGGSTTFDPISAATGTVLDLSKYTPSRTGYAFKGWATDPNATTGNYTYTVGENDVTLVAVWKQLVAVTIKVASDWKFNYTASGTAGGIEFSVTDGNSTVIYVDAGAEINFTVTGYKGILTYYASCSVGSGSSIVTGTQERGSNGRDMICKYKIAEDYYEKGVFAVTFNCDCAS